MTLPLGGFRRSSIARIGLERAPTNVTVVSNFPTVIVESDRRFPRAVASALETRHREAVTGASGQVLDLSEPSSRVVLQSAIDGGCGPETPLWDVVISVAELIRFPDLIAALGAIDHLLAPGGRLIAVEPIVVPGMLRVITCSPWSATRWLRDFHTGRDIVAALRTTTLVSDDIERFNIPTAVVPLRHFVSLGARRAQITTEVDQ